MPSWVIDILLTEAAEFILAMTGCFIAGMVSKAKEYAEDREKERRRKATEACLRVLNEQRESELNEQREPTTFYADDNVYIVFSPSIPPSYGTTERK